MTYLISNITLTLIATLVLGVGIGWLIWGRLKNQLISLETGWRERYLKLDNEYQVIVNDFNEVELALKDRITHISTLNNERNELARKLNAVTNVNSNADSEIEEIKNQLGHTTARCHIISKELDERKQELATLRDAPNEISQLKVLLGQATQRYNNNSLELKNKNEELFSLQNKFETTSRHTLSINKELETLRGQLLKRDKEFENQVVAYADSQNKLRESNEMLKHIQTELDSRNNSSIDIAQIEERDKKIFTLQQNLENERKRISELENQIKKTASQYQDSQAELADAKKHISALNNEISSLREHIPSLESSLKQRDSSISALEGEISRLAKEFPPLRDKLDTRTSQADELKQQVYTLQQKIPALKSTIAARDAHIRELEVFIKDAQKAVLEPKQSDIHSKRKRKQQIR